MQLTTTQQTRKDALEFIVESEQQAFLRVAEALISIRDESLYLDEWDTFEAYCQGRWGFSRSYAYRLIVGATAVKSLPPSMSPIGDTMTESQARELAKAPEKKRAAVVRAAIVASGDKPPTAAAIKQAVKTVTQTPTVEAVQLDEVGRKIPHTILALWNRGDEVQEMLKQISAIRCRLKKAEEDRDPLFREVLIQQTVSDLTNAYDHLKTAVPYAVCPVCNAAHMKGCQQCKERGILSKFRYATVPSELRVMNEKRGKK